MLFIFAFAILGLPYLVTSWEPQLSFNVTNDITFTCNMAGFQGRPDMLFCLQIVKVSADHSGNDTVLATVDSGDVWASEYLKQVHPIHNVSGQLRQNQKRNAWLRLTIAAFPPNENGNYSCKIVYMDHPADSNHSTWSAGLYVDSLFKGRKETAGFSVRASRGLDVMCTIDMDNDSLGPISSISISAGNDDRSVSWCQENRTVTCSPTLFASRYVALSTQSTLQAHIPEVTCADQTYYKCTAETRANRTECRERFVLGDDCPMASTNAANTTRAGAEVFDRENSVFVVVPLVLCYVVFSIIPIIIICLLKKRRKLTLRDQGLSQKNHSRRTTGKGGSRKLSSASSLSLESKTNDEETNNAQNKLLEIIIESSRDVVKLRSPEEFEHLLISSSSPGSLKEASQPADHSEFCEGEVSTTDVDFKSVTTEAQKSENSSNYLKSKKLDDTEVELGKEGVLERQCSLACSEGKPSPGRLGTVGVGSSHDEVCWAESPCPSPPHTVTKVPVQAVEDSKDRSVMV